MRDSSIAPILLAALMAVTPAVARAHHGGGGHHGSSHPSAFVFVPVFTPRLGSPGAFVPLAPVGRWGAPDPFFSPWNAPGPLPGWSYPPRPGMVLGWPVPGGVASPDATASEAARESDLDQQIGALPPQPDAQAAPPQGPPSGEDDSGWQPL
jgi:hypothetical protein